MKKGQNTGDAAHAVTGDLFNDAARDRDVGYKRPPKHRQFKPGRSGNPRGRPKHVRNFKADLLEELREKIPIRENGRDHKVSKQRAFIKALVAAAIQGDMRATNALVSFCTRSLGAETDKEDVNITATADDVGIIESFVERERKRRRFQAANERLHKKANEKNGS